MLTATYSPDDNKLRLYSSDRLQDDLYLQVRAAGFIWAPQQKLYVAPKWTPERADLLAELCGEIGDEDTSLIERAEDRADRFETYSEKRAEDAERAHEMVEAIAGHIPFGQPILVGHHSEARARKDAERIRNGMKKAVGLWETSQYWTRRAAAAVRHAKYKENPAVRHRRIKTIEADKRKAERDKVEAEGASKLWSRNDLSRELAIKIANRFSVSIKLDGQQFPDTLWSLLTSDKITVEEAAKHALAVYAETIAWANRWIAHYDFRLAYEKAMLSEALGGDAEAGATMSGRYDIQVGGRVLIGREWLAVLRVNKRDGVINSISTTPPARMTWIKTYKAGIEDIAGYEPPSAEDAAKAKAATKQAPICNYPGEGFREMTEAEWNARPQFSDFSYYQQVTATDTHCAHRVRVMPKPGKFWERQRVFLTDAKRKDPPAPAAEAAPQIARKFEPVTAAAPMPAPQAEPTAFDAMRDTLAAGVKVVAAPQLFPTPAPIVSRMIELAEIAPGDRVLEPEAGTGAIVDAILSAPANSRGGEIGLTTVEINHDLANALRQRLAGRPEVPGVICGDFLTLTALGVFDRVIMNPPFANGADIAHIKHAAGMLTEGGRLVALCANGTRQNEQLKPLASHWEVLPAGSFREQGTGVSVALLVIDKPY